VKVIADTITDNQIRELRKAPRTPDNIRQACIGALMPSWGREDAVRQHRATIAAWLAAQLPTLSEPQLALVRRALDEGGEHGIYIYGPEVRCARSLVKLGLVELTDDGVGPLGNNRDGERWSIRLIDRARCAEIWNARHGGEP